MKFTDILVNSFFNVLISMLLYLKKDIVIGFGEIGSPLYKLFSKSFIVEGHDLNPKLIPKKLKKIHHFKFGSYTFVSHSQKILLHKLKNL